MNRRTFSKALILLLAALFGSFMGNSFAGRPIQQKKKPALRQRAKAVATQSVSIPLHPAAKKNLADFFARSEDQRLVFHGSQVSTHPKVNGAALVLQQEVVKEFSQLNPNPKERQARFQYIFDRFPDLILTGWRGTILETTPGPDGIHVKVNFTPNMASRESAVSIVTDSWIENFMFSRGEKNLTYLGAEEHASAPIRMLISD